MTLSASFPVKLANQRTVFAPHAFISAYVERFHLELPEFVSLKSLATSHLARLKVAPKS